MSLFLPDVQKLSPYVMVEVTSWHPASTKWLKSILASSGRRSMLYPCVKHADPARLFAPESLPNTAATSTTVGNGDDKGSTSLGRMERMFSSKRLELYYNTKYEAEASNPLTQTLKYTPFPSNRFEACLKFFLNRFKEGDILVLGAGSGLLARSLIAHELKFNTYTLSELSSNRLRGISQSFHDPRICVIELDAEAIPDDELARYDAVIMLAHIEHLIDPLGAMKRIHKLLSQMVLYL